jgi:hypothetical protein
MSTLDLNNPPSNHNLTLSLEPEEKNLERYARLFKDLALFLVSLGFVILITFLCYQTLISQTAQAEEKKWAMSVISAATGGIIGYLIRK